MDGGDAIILLLIIVVILYTLYRQGVLAKLAAKELPAQPSQPGGQTPAAPMVDPHQYIWAFANSAQTEIGRATVAADGHSQTLIAVPAGTAFITCGVTKTQTGETGWTGWVGYSGQNSAGIMLGLGTKDYAHGLSLRFANKSGAATPPNMLAKTFF